MRYRSPPGAGMAALGYGLALACALLVGIPFAKAQAPLHQRIDDLIAAGQPGLERHAAPVAADPEFLRRIYLDLTGTIPTAAEARAFLNDPAPGKRQQWIDRLLAGPEYARDMQTVVEGVLMERRPEQNV